MKAELVQFYVKDDCLKLYEVMQPCGFDQRYRRFGLYLGEDEAHVWIYPLIVGTVESDPNQLPRIIVGSVLRFMKNTIVLQEPGDIEMLGLSGPFSDMKYSGGSFLE